MGNYLPLQFTHPGDSKHSPVTDSSFKQTWLDNESISVTIDDNEDVLFDVTNVSPSPCPQISMDRFGAAAGGPPIFSPQPGYPPIADQREIWGLPTAGPTRRMEHRYSTPHPVRL